MSRDPLCESCGHELSRHEFEDVEDGIAWSADCFCSGKCECREYVNPLVFRPMPAEMIAALESAANEIAVHIALDEIEDGFQ